MDDRLVAWARRVKRRRGGPPPLWLFTDRARLADPCEAAARLPRGLAGVVLREECAPDRAALGARLARICRARRLMLVVAGDWRLAAVLGAGLHLRGGRWPVGAGRTRLVTSSAHSASELRRALSTGAGVVFLSPAFATLSHPGAPSLGPLRWRALARAAPSWGWGRVAALGGIDGTTVRRLGCRIAGAIGALG